MFEKLPALKSLLAFSVASRSKNFSVAAKQLYITQSAISHQIKNLEGFLGHKLFYRQGKTVQLTEQGKLFALAVNQGFDHILSATQELIGQQDKAIQLGVSSTFAIHRLTPVLDELYQRNADLDIRLRMLSCGDPITELDLDIILYDSPIEHVSYECEQLKLEVYYPVANAALAQRLISATPQSWLKQQAFIEIESVDLWRRWFEQMNVAMTEKATLFFSHTILCLRAALSGQGIALLGETLIREELANGQLVKLVEQGMTLGQDGFYFSWHKRRKNDPNIGLIKNWLIAIL